MLELLEDEVIRTLGLLGATSFAGLDKSYLHPATARDELFEKLEQTGRRQRVGRSFCHSVRCCSPTGL